MTYSPVRSHHSSPISTHSAMHKKVKDCVPQPRLLSDVTMGDIIDIRARRAPQWKQLYDAAIQSLVAEGSSERIDLAKSVDRMKAVFWIDAKQRGWQNLRIIGLGR